jgi:hypothetical protein
MSPTLTSRPVTRVVPQVVDRCDRCSAAARMSLRLAAGGELSFCGHHGNRFVDQILALADRVSVESGYAWRGATTTFGFRRTSNVDE